MFKIQSLKFKIQSLIFKVKLDTLYWLIKTVSDGNAKKQLKEKWETVALEWLGCMEKRNEETMNYIES